MEFLCYLMSLWLFSNEFVKYSITCSVQNEFERMFNEFQCHRYTIGECSTFTTTNIGKTRLPKTNHAVFFSWITFVFYKLHVEMGNNVEWRICGFQPKMKMIQTRILFHERNYIVYTKKKRDCVAYAHELMNKISFSIMLNRIVKYIARAIIEMLLMW